MLPRFSERISPSGAFAPSGQAGNGTRTRDPNLGKVVLYQLSYSRELNDRTNHKPHTPTDLLERRLGCSSSALHDKCSGHGSLIMEARGIEPLTS